LLYDEGFTIRGVQRLLRERGAKAITAGEVPALSLAHDDDRHSTGSPVAQAGEDQINSADELLHAQNGAELPHTANGSRRENYETAPRVPHFDRRALEAVLEELSECRRILDGALYPRS
jgi:hypothetical protein